ncbi:MAG: hypothetical protein ACK452_10685 [Bacteroidota bacterium]
MGNKIENNIIGNKNSFRISSSSLRYLILIIKRTKAKMYFVIALFTVRIINVNSREKTISGVMKLAAKGMKRAKKINIHINIKTKTSGFFVMKKFLSFNHDISVK